MESKHYKGNLVKLRHRKDRILQKKHLLSLQIKQYEKMKSKERDKIFDSIEALGKEISRIDKEILKVQLAMKNSLNWMDGEYNPVIDI